MCKWKNAVVKSSMLKCFIIVVSLLNALYRCPTCSRRINSVVVLLEHSNNRCASSGGVIYLLFLESSATNMYFRSRVSMFKVSVFVSKSFSNWIPNFNGCVSFGLMREGNYLNTSVSFAHPSNGQTLQSATTLQSLWCVHRRALYKTNSHPREWETRAILKYQIFSSIVRHKFHQAEIVNPIILWKTYSIQKHRNLLSCQIARWCHCVKIKHDRSKLCAQILHRRTDTFNP